MSDYFNLNEGIKEVKSKFPKFGSLRSKINKKILFVILIAAIGIPLTVILSQQEQDTRQFASEKDQTKQEEKPLPPKGYIVEFKNAPASRAISGNIETVSNENVRNSFNAAKANLLREHASGKADILTKLGKSSFDNSKFEKGDKKVVLLSEFTNSFNGIAVDADEEEIEKIKKSPFVKAVYPNLAVKTNLMDSVPLIGADKVWRDIRDANGNPVTGKGVNIAILDTGVDYTHPDLGNSPYVERPLQKLEGQMFINYYSLDGAISYNKDRLAYVIGNDVAGIYDFTSKTSKDIILNTNDIPEPYLHTVFLEGENLFYTSLSYKAVNLYMKNLKTGELKKISDLGLIDVPSGEDLGHIASVVSRYTYSDGKLYYERQSGALSSDNFILYNVYSYDLEKEVEEKLFEDTKYVRFAKVFGNKLVYSVYDPANYNYSKNIIRDLDTGDEKEVSFPGVGPVIDFKNNLILSKYYGSYGTFNLYNTDTEEVKSFSYQGVESSGSIAAQNFEYSITFGYNLDKGMIGDGVIFFQKNSDQDQIVAYDLSNNKYSLINLKTFSGAVVGEGNKICFTSKLDLHIYCHTYDPSYDYALAQLNYNSKVKGGFNFIDGSNFSLDDNGHGSHVAGIAAGNGILKGVAPEANIYSYKVLNSYGSGYISSIIWAIDNAIQTRYDSDLSNDISVINLSLGASCFQVYSSNCGPGDPLSRSVNNAFGNGIVVVAAAGNGGQFDDLISTPGTASRSITVGSVDKQKRISSFSSRGPVNYNGIDYKKPDVVAPGSAICSSRLFGLAWPYFGCLDSNHASLSGTSMATPHVAGLAALILQAHPDWTPEQVKDAIKNNTDDLGYDYNTQGAGLINAVKLFGLELTPAPSPTPSPSPTPTPSPSPTPFPTPANKILNLTPSGDAYVRKDKPTNNYGLLTNIQTDSTPSTISFMKFNLSSLDGKKIVKAKLVLKVSQASDLTQALKRAEDKAWSEKNINHNNKPSLVATIRTFNAKPAGETIDLDVKNAVNLKKGGILTLGIASSGNEITKYYSRESASSNRPQLIVEYQ